MSTLIPSDAKDKAVFLYHPTIKDNNGKQGSKRVDITDRNPNASSEIAALKRDGWTENRFAQAMYHQTKPCMVCTDPKAMPQLLKEGWQKSPFPEATQN
jgi:hypothetical protein